MDAESNDGTLQLMGHVRRNADVRGCIINLVGESCQKRGDSRLSFVFKFLKEFRLAVQGHTPFFLKLIDHAIQVINAQYFIVYKSVQDILT